MKKRCVNRTSRWHNFQVTTVDEEIALLHPQSPKKIAPIHVAEEHANIQKFVLEVKDDDVIEFIGVQAKQISNLLQIAREYGVDEDKLEQAMSGPENLCSSTLVDVASLDEFDNVVQQSQSTQNSTPKSSSKEVEENDEIDEWYEKLDKDFKLDDDFDISGNACTQSTAQNNLLVLDRIFANMSCDYAFIMSAANEIKQLLSRDVDSLDIFLRYIQNFKRFDVAQICILILGYIVAEDDLQQYKLCLTELLKIALEKGKQLARTRDQNVWMQNCIDEMENLLNYSENDVRENLNKIFCDCQNFVGYSYVDIENNRQQQYIRFIFEYVKLLCIVLNQSLGLQRGGHDGQSPNDQQFYAFVSF
eukprot:TRINITY_DN128_c0_g1_i2.p2 TRINITY_DN128_c0_g1~~TRINITY_DN128_c0_g1_i2.p2  ORF type:complete len:361 (-),score=54.82 TRINITY_DN128_c0_g1_i2:441-1523(-)